jgi:hypothetical protein
MASVALANGDKPTQFTIRIENITKPDAFTASNGVKWSLAFSPGTAIVHTENAPISLPKKKIAVRVWKRNPRTVIPACSPSPWKAARELDP